MHGCRYMHVFECVFCGWVVERVWVHVSESVCLGVNVCGPMYEEESVLNNSGAAQQIQVLLAT